MAHIALIGGGRAAAACARKLRASGFDGQLSIFCAENHLPYDRPPLSKSYLKQQAGPENLLIYPQKFYDDQDISLFLSTRIDRIDPVNKALSSGTQTWSYDQLVLATGASARPLPPFPMPDEMPVYILRDQNDAHILQPHLQPDRQLLIIGGGYVGLEVAATATLLGLKVTVIERAPRILQRVASENLSVIVRNLHQAHGVEIKEDAFVEKIDRDGSQNKAHLSDGTKINCDLVLAGVGAMPNVALADSAGIELENGIRTDIYGQTSIPSIWAIGDCASFPYKDSRIRLESIQNAIDQAETVAENILGQQKPYHPVPTFWSEQYKTMIQIAGLRTEGGETIPRPNIRPDKEPNDPADPSASFWFYQGQELCAVEAVADAKSFLSARRFLTDGFSPPRDKIADPTISLKQMRPS